CSGVGAGDIGKGQRGHSRSQCRPTFRTARSEGASVMSEQFHWVGQRVKRREDRRLLKGEGRFIDDLQIPGVYHAAILRSPYPHARIKAVRTEAARNLPGVVGVITGEDVKKQCKPFPVGVPRPPAYYPLAIEKARF